MAGSEELLLIQRHAGRHMRRWWLTKGSWWLLLLLLTMGFATYGNEHVSEYALSHGLPVIPPWLLVNFWFPTFAVGVWLVGALEASHYVDKLLESATIPDARFPLKARAVLCFVQGVWPGALVAIVLAFLWAGRTVAALHIGHPEAPFSLWGEFSVQGLDFLECALVGLWVVGLLVVRPNHPWASMVWLACFFLYSGQYDWGGALLAGRPLGGYPRVRGRSSRRSRLLPLRLASSSLLGAWTSLHRSSSGCS